MPHSLDRSRFRAAAVAVLVLNLAVILWGAVVRATGSGAGCGDHWPTCNGDVIPRSPALATLIEFSHRSSAGVALVSVLALTVLAFTTFERGHPVRRAAGFSMGFMVGEALVGASLVLLKLVAHDASVQRAIFISLHQVNTFALLSALVLTVFWSTGTRAICPADSLRVAPVVPASVRAAVRTTLVVLPLLGATGAVVALGDTLFPSASLAAGIAQDFSPAAHFLMRLRIVHPALAVVSALYLVTAAVGVASTETLPRARTPALTLAALLAAQLAAGFLNLALRAPIAMQLVHLFLADLAWIAAVWLAGETLARTVVTAEQAVAPGA